MKTHLRTWVGGALGTCQCWVEEMETLPERHLNHELAQYVRAEPSREEEFREYFAGKRPEGFVGDTVVSTTAIDLSDLDALIEAVRQAGGPARAFKTLRDELASIETLRRQYADGASRTLVFRQLADALREACAAATKANDKADRAFRDWPDARRREAIELGTKIGDEVFLAMEDIAHLNGSGVDAARKWVRERGIKRHSFGRRKYVLLSDLLRASDEEAEG